MNSPISIEPAHLATILSSRTSNTSLALNGIINKPILAKQIRKITQVPQGPVGEDDAKVEVVGGVGAVRGHAPVDDGRVGAARGVEQQPVLQGLSKSRISTHECCFFTRIWR